MGIRSTLRYVGAVLAVSVTLGVGGCSEPDATSTEDTVSESTPPPESSTPETPTSETATPSDPAATQPRVAQDAVADLAGMLGIAASDIEVVRVEEVSWRDGSIGCAEPGKMYTQAIVDGQRVVLSAQGMQYEYHSGGPRGLFRCEKPTQ